MLYKGAPLAHRKQSHSHCWFSSMLTLLVGMLLFRRDFLGPAGPKVKEPLWVLIHANHAGQRTDIHRATGFWEPELNPTINRNLDSRPMVGTTYLERPAPAVYLDSWPMEAKVRSKNLEWKPMKISAINCKLDSQPMVGTTYLERPAPAVYLDSWPMEAKVRSKQREWKPVIFPPDSYTLDSQLMVGTTYLERPAPAVYLDSWLMKGASYPQHHIDREVLSSKPSLNNVAIVKMVDTDASDDVNTHLPENVTLMTTPMTATAWPCVASPQSSTEKNDMVNRMKDSRVMIMTRPENAPPMIDPIVTQKNMPENLTPVSTPMTALTWPCVDSPRSPTAQDSNGSIKYWEDRICHPLIYVGDLPHNVLKTTSHNPEAANIQHEADEIFTSTGRTATRPEVAWMWRVIRTRTLLRSWSIIHGMMQEHGNSATHEGI